MRRMIALGLLSLASQARAQDVEVQAQLHGRAVPQGYYDRVREKPDFFTWPNVWAPTPQLVDPWRDLSRASSRHAPRAGTFPVLVIPALFNDTPSPHITDAALQATLFDGPSQYGTITEVYREISQGNLTLKGRVTPWVRTGLPLAQVLGTSNGLGRDALTGEYLRQALVKADSLYDFGQFDNNGSDGIPNSGDDDGVVDAFIVLYLERSAPCGGQGVWPHLSSYSGWNGTPYVSNDRSPRGTSIVANGYMMLSATECTSNDIMPPAILAHELGHALGLPDLYDSRAGIGPSFRRWVVGCWDLMGAGAWGCGDGSAVPTAKRPTHYGAWSKDQLGWTDPIVVGTVRDKEFTLRPAHVSNDVLRIPIAGAEWYDIEYRQRAGYDGELAASGIAIFHIDPKISAMPCQTCAPIYRTMMIEADGNGAMIQISNAGGNRGEAGDVFGPAGRTRFSGATTPAAKRRDGGPFPFAIHSIVFDSQAGVARLRLTTDPNVQVSTPLPTEAWPALVDQTRRMRLTGGALPYVATVSGTLPNGLTVTTDQEDVVVRGTPLRAGSFPLTIAVRDQIGVSTQAAVSLAVSEPTFALPSLLQSLLRSDQPALSVPAEQYMDVQGNGNGRYDVGDLRAYLLAHPSLR